MFWVWIWIRISWRIGYKKVSLFFGYAMEDTGSVIDSVGLVVSQRVSYLFFVYPWDWDDRIDERASE